MTASTTSSQKKTATDHFRGVLSFLNGNKTATICLAVLLLAMIVMETKMSVFGMEFGFTSTTCPEVKEAK